MFLRTGRNDQSLPLPLGDRRVSLLGQHFWFNGEPQVEPADDACGLPLNDQDESSLGGRLISSTTVSPCYQNSTHQKFQSGNKFAWISNPETILQGRRITNPAMARVAIPDDAILEP